MVRLPQALIPLKSKFKTVDGLVAGAKNDMMKPIQADEAKLKAAAAEIMK
jgi:hypothetical protein